MARILSISYDESLLTTRQLMLESQGHQVSSALGFTKALALCQKDGHDFVIVGHSIPHDDKLALINEIRHHCKAPVLALKKTTEPPVEEADHNLDFTQQPEQFLAFVKSALAQRGRPGSA